VSAKKLPNSKRDLNAFSNESMLTSQWSTTHWTDHVKWRN
jgi:hypothetical protein